MALSFDRAISGLDSPGRFECWRADFDASAVDAEDSRLDVPTGAALEARCRRYDLPDAAVAVLLEKRAQWDDPRIRRLGAHYQWLCRNRYSMRADMEAGWPDPPAEGTLLYAYAAIGLADEVAADQAARGIPASVTRETLSDIGVEIAVNRRTGRGDTVEGRWLVHHLSGHLFRLGRLQFQRSCRPGYVPLAPGEAFLDVHVPAAGPLSPDACDASFDHARAFFARHFSGDRVRLFACASWLLDPELASLLPEDSNIVRFQRRFEIIASGKDYSGVFRFVFGRPELDREKAPDVLSLPQRTALERALVAHYRRGGRIGAGIGILPLVGAAGGSVAPSTALRPS